MGISRFVPHAFVTAAIFTATQNALAFGGTARELERQGNFVITNNADFVFNHQIGDRDATVFVLRPALDYFVIKNLAVGGAVEFDIAAPANGPSTTRFALAPEVGYEFALSDTWSFWPQLALPVSFPNPGNPSLTLVTFAPFLVHPAQHFFVGIGPGFSQGLTSNPNTFITGGFRIGGYFDH